jgi:hypothetical protein
MQGSKTVREFVSILLLVMITLHVERVHGLRVLVNMYCIAVNVRSAIGKMILIRQSK